MAPPAPWAPPDGKQSRELIERLPALPCGDKSLPVGDGEIDGRKCPRAQDRASNDNASSRLLIDDKIGANARALPIAAPCAGLWRSMQSRWRRRSSSAGCAMYFRFVSRQRSARRRVIPIATRPRHSAGWFRRDCFATMARPMTCLLESRV